VEKTDQSPDGVRRCIFCGCTDDKACQLASGEPCAWLITDPPVCNAPDCFRRLATWWQQGVARRRRKEAKQSREGRTLTGPLFAALRFARLARLRLQLHLERT
jgi:hypothetical protein